MAVPTLAFAEAGDKPVKESELPPAVAKAIKSAAAEAKLGPITLGDEDGKKAYEAKWQAGGRKHEITVAVDGKVLSVEEIIPLAEAPEAVRAAVAHEEGGAQVKEVEKVLADGKTSYEVDLKSGKTKGEVVFDKNGKVIKREKEEGKKEKKD